MEKVLINGDLYVKCLPDVVDRVLFDEDSLDDNERRQVDISQLDINPSEMEDMFIQIYEDFNRIFESLPVSKIKDSVYDNNIGFYRLNMTGNKINFISEKCIQCSVYLVQKDDDKKLEFVDNHVTYSYDNIEEINGKFINLFDFLVNASYAGFTLDSFQPDLERMHVLYEYLDTYLVLDDNNTYSVISKMHPRLKKYFKSGIIENVYNKSVIYKEIFAQKINNLRGPKK